MDELTRRIQAACSHHGIEQTNVEGRLYLNSGRDTPLVIAGYGPSGLTVNRPVVDELVEQLISKGIDVLVVDPFVSSHSLPENDNSAIDAAVKEWGRVAGLANCAVELVHHVRKTGGDEITAEDSRGGKAFVDALRSVRILNRMTKSEAGKAGIDDGHWRYFRSELGKTNMATSEKADWYRMDSVELGNGDNVGVVTSWSWPDPLEAVSVHDLLAVQKAIAAGEWREDVRSKKWVGGVVADTLGFDKDNNANRARIKALLKTWIVSGALRTERRRDEEIRKPFNFVLVGEWAEP